jgi:cellulose synthase/poly-beta-1,6-N-acetylglucosamine synthase-like glycosyltransferase
LPGKIKAPHIRQKKVVYNLDHLPTLTLIVAAYNEANIIEEKIQNTLALHLGRTHENYH